MKEKLSVIIPTISSENIIKGTLVTVNDYLSELEDEGIIKDYEIVVVGQQDGFDPQDVLYIKLNELKKTFPKMKLIFLCKKGKGNAIMQGLLHSKHQWNLIYDDDLEYDLKVLPKMLEYTDSIKIIIASRYNGGTTENVLLKRKILSWGYRWLARTLLTIQTKDIQSGMKLIDKDILMDMKQKGFCWDTELIYLAENNLMPIIEVPVKYTYKGKKEIAPHTLPMLKDLLKLFLKYEVGHEHPIPR
jgi:glycosyltransferase involved in cell wall biosynthesis